MRDRRDPFEDHLAEQLAALADQSMPARRPSEEVAATAMEQVVRPRWRLALLAVACLVAAVATMVTVDATRPGVGADRSSAASAAVPSPPNEAAGLTYTCGGPAFSPEIVNEPEFDLETTAAGAALAEFIASDPREGRVLPENGWHVLSLDETSAAFLASARGDPPYATAEVELREGTWRVVGWGGCRPQVAVTGVNPATWSLVAGQGIGHDTTAFFADVTEVNCAGGASSEDRLRPPLIAYEAGRVVVIFTVEPLPGDSFTCQGNPSTRVRVELSEPLGDRSLLDGGTFPWEDRLATAPDSELWWGPLAVADWVGGDQALLTGRLRIGEECVTVETRSRDDVLVVWPTDRTGWNPDDRTIRFVNPDGRSVTVAHGEDVTFVGGGGSTEESGVSGEDWRETTDWFRPPSETCSLEAWWGVGEIINLTR